jgi:flagellar hook assembly protein FlgD
VLNYVTWLSFANCRQDGPNVLGQKVAVLTDEIMTAGMFQTTWDGVDLQGRSVASGVYFYRIKTGDWTQTRSMALVEKSA